MSDEANEELGQCIDTLDNLAHALALPMPPAFHVEQMKSVLPELVGQMKAAYSKVAGSNPREI